MSSKSKAPKHKKESRGSDSDSDEDKSIKLSNNRYLTVSQFKNRVRVDIREYYLNDEGERKPGKKGISLSLEEWKKIVANMDKIKKAIKEAGSDSDSD
ncbi:Ssb-c31ap [Tyrophagus putrescentiae]|nr:Ssb-c31ap [Tyrophagus putrescentiae]